MGCRRKWRDVTLTVRSGMISWPGDPVVEVALFKQIAKGSRSNVSLLTLGSHTGTHVDAPRHFIEGGTTVDAIDPELLIGPVRVIRIAAGSRIMEKDLRGLRFRRGERILFRTMNSGSYRQDKGFNKGFVHLSAGAAAFLVSRGVIAIGVDYLSVGGYQSPDGAEVHRLLLGAGILVIEGLDLSGILPGHYDMVCLPLKLSQGDGAPARVFLRSRK